MKKLLIVFTLLLFACIAWLNGQEEKNEQHWSCIVETVKPEMLEQYLELSHELIKLCKEENFPFEFHTWSNNPMEFELWSPLESLDDIEKIEDEWDKIMEKWGKEKNKAFNATKTKNYAKTCNVRWDLQFRPANPDYDPNNANYQRWIEVYLKPGTEKEFEEAVKWINEIRKAHDYGVLCNFAECGLGYETPSFLVMYGHDNRIDYLEYEENLDEAYMAEYQKYRTKIGKLLAKPAKFYDIQYLPEMSYTPAAE